MTTYPQASYSNVAGEAGRGLESMMSKYWVRTGYPQGYAQGLSTIVRTAGLS
jgi:hypothetical protein